MKFEYNPKETFYTFYHRKDKHDNFLTPYKFPLGSFLLEFLDLDFDKIYSEFPYSFKRHTNYYGIYENEFYYSYISKRDCSPILYIVIEQSCSLYLKYFEKVSLSENASSFMEQTRSFFDTLKGLQSDLSIYLLTKEIESGSMLSIADCSQNIKVSFHFYEDSNEIYSEYEINDVISAIQFDLVNCVSKSVNIKQCNNCHKFFIPAKRSDEIYCDRIYRNNKTCKQIGYEEKAKSDLFMQAYTKARKTQHARIRYNSHIENYKEKHYEPWKESAEKARDSFKENNDIDGFLKWLDENKNSF